MRRAFPVILLLCLIASAAFGRDDQRRAQIQAAHTDALASLTEDVRSKRLLPDMTVGQFAQKTGSVDRLRRSLERSVRQVGDTRWPNSETCQVQLQVPGEEVARELVAIAADERDKSPLPAEALGKRLADWQGITFSATGASMSAAAVQSLQPAANQPVWLSASEPDRRAAVASAQQNAALVAMEQLADLPLGDGRTVADAMKVPAVRQAVQDWIATRPVTDVELLENGEVRLTVAAPGEELWDVFRDALSRQKEVAAPKDDAGWEKLRDEVVSRLTIRLGGRGTVATRPQVNGAPPQRVALPQRPPRWVGQQVDGDGSAAGRRSHLLRARAAEAEALQDLRQRIEALPLENGRTLGDAARADAAVSQAIDRSLTRARTAKVDYGATDSVTVRLSLDLRHVWQELQAAR